jgi:hypothetical protein
MTRRSRQAALGVGLTLIASAAFAAPAGAASTRAEYVAQVNPICASANAQAEQLYESVSQELNRLNRKANRARGKKRRKLEARSERLFEQLPDLSLAIYYTELERLKAVAPAAGDESLVSEWLATRQAGLDLTAQANRIEKRAERLFSRGFEGHSLRAAERWEKKLEKLEKQVNQLYQQAEPLYEKDIELGTKLGATYCVTQATGTA